MVINFLKKYRKILLRSTCILLALALFTMASYSLAKYVSTNEEKTDAGVAKLGIEIFELTDSGKTDTTIDYTKIVPGANISGPSIKLKMYSEISWSIYVTVTEIGFPVGPEEDKDEENSLDKAKGNSITAQTSVVDENGETRRVNHQVISYYMADDWSLSETKRCTGTADDGTQYTYYVKTYVYNKVFKPATKYNHTNEFFNDYETLYEIPLLAGSEIFVSQYYGDYNYGSDLGGKDNSNGSANVPPHYQQNVEFSLIFEAYIRQVQ